MPPKWIIADHECARQIALVFANYPTAIACVRMLGQSERLGRERFIVPFWDDPYTRIITLFSRRLRK
jgi:hypothetical protein